MRRRQAVLGGLKLGLLHIPELGQDGVSVGHGRSGSEQAIGIAVCVWRAFEE